MRRSLRLLARSAKLALFVLLSTLLAVQPVAAQAVLRDAETEALWRDSIGPIIAAAGLDPKNVKVVVIGDKEINAFVAGGQIVYIHSGLIEAADNLNQVQGVVAHELGHVAGGHIPLQDQMTKGATGIMILSLLLGAAAMAMGGGEAGAGVMSAGQQAAMGKVLAFSRAQEASADAAGASYLLKAGVSGKGFLDFFGKLRQQEYRLSSSYYQTDPFMQTHPMSGERQATLEPDLKASPYWGKQTPPELEARFQRIKAKLIGFTEDPTTALRKYPETDNSQPAHYARAYAYHRGAYPDKAVEEVDKLVAAAPHDPYYLELKGQILLESGKPRDAIAPLREAVARSNNEPLISSLLGHALIATEDPANFKEAREVLRLSIARDNDNPFAWYQLGIVYDHEGDEGRAALATAERYNLEGNTKLALNSARAAMANIPQGTSDYLRAQDIMLVSQNAARKDKKNKDN